MRRYHIEKALHICRDELKMREHVFRKDPMKRKKKTEEMQYVIKVLKECEELCIEEQKELFGAG